MDSRTEKIDGAETARWDALVDRAGGHYTQTSMWAEVKHTVGWTRRRVALARDGELVGGTQLLLRTAPLLGPVAVVPSAPVVTDGDEVLEEVVEDLMRLCAHERVSWLKVQPTGSARVTSEQLEGILRRRGFIRSDVQARDEATMRVRLDPDAGRVLASMRRNTRANIRRAERKGAVTVREGTEADLETFAALMAATADRQAGMPLFPPGYYEQAWRSFTTGGAGRLMLAEHDGQPLSAILLVTYGDTCEYLYGGWNRARPDLHPNEFLQWSAMKWACGEGFGWYELGNIDPAIARRLLAGEHVPADAATGQTRYKLGFNGEARLHPPAYDQTGRRVLRPVLRLAAPRLSLATPLLLRVRGLAKGGTATSDRAPTGADPSRADQPERGRGSRRHGEPALPRLLVTADDFHASLAFVRALRAGGYLPMLAVSQSGTYAARSRAVVARVTVPTPEDSPVAFARAVGHAAAELEVDGVLPGTEASLIALSRREDPLPCPAGVPAREVVDIATSKAHVLELADETGFDTLPSIIARAATLIERADRLEYPVILKPLRTLQELTPAKLMHHRARKLTSAEQLRAVLLGLPDVEWVLQPFVQAKLAAVSGVAWEGQVMSAVHQISHRIWPPEVGYSSYAETVPPNPQLEACLAALLARIGWSGMFQLQFLRTQNQRFVIDFNPRPYGSLALAVRAGANLPALWAALTLGQPASPQRYRAGVRYRLEHRDLKALAYTARNGDLRGGLSGLIPRPRTVHAVFSLRDPGPALTTAAKVRQAWRG